MSQRRTNSRLLVAVLALLVGFGLLVARAVVLQVVHAADYAELAAKQQERFRTIDAPRGVITDRSGTVLAVSRPAFTVCANPRAIDDPADTAARLATALDLPASQVRPSLEGDRAFAYVARQVTPQVEQRVEQLELEGVWLVPDTKRYYPQTTVAGQLLGFVNVDGVGVDGVEKEFDARLSGKQGAQQVVQDRDGKVMEVVAERGEQPGSALALTIDQEIQYWTESVLANTIEQYKATKATAVVLDPDNGDVLAMANAPLFDANAYQKADPDIRRNAAVTDVYEPGSTFKMVAVAGALEAGLVTPDTVFTLPRSITLGGKKIGDHEEGLPAVRRLAVRDILAQSSNVGAVKIGQKLGKDRLMGMVTRFGFGRQLGTDFLGEVKGILPREPWSGSTIGNVPIGQGIATTPLQIASAYATIANDGVAVSPHLIRQETSSPGRRVVTAETARQLKSMLTWTVSEGTGKAASVVGYEVAGKTGTAQKVVDGRYSKSEYVSSFVGMIPADDPRVVVLVVVDYPKTAHLGSAVAAPAFSKIAEFAMKHLQIPPSRRPRVDRTGDGFAGRLGAGGVGARGIIWSRETGGLVQGGRGLPDHRRALRHRLLPLVPHRGRRAGPPLLLRARFRPRRPRLR